MTWPAVALAGLNVIQVIGLAWIAAYAKRTSREVERINGELSAAVAGQRRTAAPYSTE